jgi:hypothetical protein
MADVHKLSDRVIDYAERTSAVADAAQGKGLRRRRTGMRWLLLPAAGAGLYALMTNGSFTRKAKEVMTEAKDRASDLPEELVDRVQEATGQTSGTSRSRQSSQKSSASRSRSSRQGSRKTTASAR